MQSFYNSLMFPVSFDDVAAAHERIRAQAKRTPVLSSSTVDALTGARVFFKCENFQRMGAFKFRGAYNALAQLSPEEKRRGAIAFSSGNHAQAVALAGEILDVKTLIVMPAIAARHMLRGCKVLGVEPAAGDDATQSFKTKTLKVIPVPDTIADGARTTSLGKLTFPLVLEYVDDMLTVTDDELLRAMFFLWERMKIIVEPTGALAACALLEKKLDARALAGRRVGVILSGGNVDLRWAAARLQARP